MNLHCGCSLGQDFTFHAIGPENDVGVFCALKNFLMHLLVPHAMTAMAAGGINHHFPAHLADRWFVIHPAPLKLKSSVDGVERVSEGKRDRGFGGNKLKHYSGSLSTPDYPQNQRQWDGPKKR